MISVVAEMYEIHPQTLRMYEREGLLRPSRSDGNTRLYTDEDLERLEFILNLARDLGVNIAGIAIVLQMRERMEEMNRQMQGFVDYVRDEMLTRINQQTNPGGRAGASQAGDLGGRESPGKEAGRRKGREGGQGGGRCVGRLTRSGKLRGEVCRDALGFGGSFLGRDDGVGDFIDLLPDGGRGGNKVRAAPAAG